MPEEFFRRTTVTGQSYDVFKCVKIVNFFQAAFYVSEGVPLRDMKLSKDKNGRDIFVFYFYREDTVDAYKLWCDNKEKKND